MLKYNDLQILEYKVKHDCPYYQPSLSVGFIHHSSSELLYPNQSHSGFRGGTGKTVSEVGIHTAWGINRKSVGFLQ